MARILFEGFLCERCQCRRTPRLGNTKEPKI